MSRIKTNSVKKKYLIKNTIFIFINETKASLVESVNSQGFLVV